MSSSSSSSLIASLPTLDATTLRTAFDAASSYLSSSKSPKLSNEQKLKFYGLFKQSTVGPCNTAKPGMLDFVGKAKWQAWIDLGSMAAHDAQIAYITELAQLVPDWRPQTADPSAASISTAAAPTTPHQNDGLDSDDDDDDGDSSRGGGGGGGFSLAAPLSRPIETDEAEVTESEKTIGYYTANDQIEKVRELVRQGVSIDDKDQEGRTYVRRRVGSGGVARVWNCV